MGQRPTSTSTVGALNRFDHSIQIDKNIKCTFWVGQVIKQADVFVRSQPLTVLALKGGKRLLRGSGFREALARHGLNFSRYLPTDRATYATYLQFYLMLAYVSTYVHIRTSSICHIRNRCISQSRLPRERRLQPTLVLCHLPYAIPPMNHQIPTDHTNNEQAVIFLLFHVFLQSTTSE